MLRRKLKTLILTLWFCVILYSGYLFIFNDLSFSNVIDKVHENFLDLKGLKYSEFILPLFFVSIFILRPLLLIPTWVMNVIAYLIFGAFGGFILVILSEQLSALSLYFAIKYLAGDTFKEEILKGAKRFKLDITSSENKELITVLILRLASLPFDFITSLCALSSIRLKPFLLGTFFASIPYVGLFFLTFRSISRHSINSTLIHGIVFLGFIGLSFFIVKKSNLLTGLGTEEIE